MTRAKPDEKQARLTIAEIAEIIGVSPESLHRMRQRPGYMPDPDGYEWRTTAWHGNQHKEGTWDKTTRHYVPVWDAETIAAWLPTRRRRGAPGNQHWKRRNLPDQEHVRELVRKAESGPKAGRAAARRELEALGL